MIKKILLLALVSIGCSLEAQGVLVKEVSDAMVTPDPSAILHIESANKGFLYPRVSLDHKTDKTLVTQPLEGTIVYNPKAEVNTLDNVGERLNFWHNNQWNKVFEERDGERNMPVLRMQSKSVNPAVAVTDFPAQSPSFQFESAPSDNSNWVDLGISMDVNITNPTNNNRVVVEGMAAVNNRQAMGFQFAIGIFVNKKLKVVRKFYEGETGSCAWRKFNVSGVFQNLPQGTNKVEVYAMNLPKVGDVYDRIIYGGGAAEVYNPTVTNPARCGNLNATVTKVYLNIQSSEVKL